MVNHPYTHTFTMTYSVYDLAFRVEVLRFLVVRESDFSTKYSFLINDK